MVGKNRNKTASASKILVNDDAMQRIDSTSNIFGSLASQTEEDSQIHQGREKEEGYQRIIFWFLANEEEQCNYKRS